MNIYKKYCEAEGWTVSTISASEADMGGYKTCVLQITGNPTIIDYSIVEYIIYIKLIINRLLLCDM